MRSLPLVFVSALAFLGAEVAVAAEPPGDDSLPKGAKLRLGSDRLTHRFQPTATLAPPDYKTFLISDTSLNFRRYDAATGKPLGGEKAGSNPAGMVVVSADGKRAIVLHSGILTVRDAATGQAIRELNSAPGIGTYVISDAAHVSLSADGKRAAQGVMGPNNTSAVLIWDVDTGTVLTRFEGLQAGGVLPVLSADGKLLATRVATRVFTAAGAKRDDPAFTVRVWDVGEKKELFKGQVTTNTYSFSACAFSPDGSLLAASWGDGSIEMWDVKAQKHKATLLGRTGQGVRVAFSPDSKTLAAVASDGAVQRWATSDGKLLATTEPPTELPGLLARGVAFVDGERVVAWGGLGPTVVAWESPSGKFLKPLNAHVGAIKSIGFATGGKQIVTTGLDGRVVRWDAVTGQATGTTGVRPSQRSSVHQPLPVLHLAPDASRIFGLGIQAAAVFDPGTGTELFALPRTAPGGFFVRTISSADVTRAVALGAPPGGSADANWTATIWDLVDRKKVVEWGLPVTTNAGFDVSAALSPSGDRLVVARYAKGANVQQSVICVTGFDLKTGKKLGDVEDHSSSNGLLSVAAASETTAVVTSGAGRLRLFNYEDGRGGDEIEAGGRGERGAAVVFSPDGKRFAFGVPADEAFGVRVYDWPSGKPLHTFTGHRAPVTALAFSPDGKTLASGSEDTTVLLWDMTKVAAPK